VIIGEYGDRVSDQQRGVRMAEAGPILDSRQRATVQILGSWCGTVGLWDLVNSRRGVSFGVLSRP